MYQFVRAALASGCMRWLAMLAALCVVLSPVWGSSAPAPLADRKWAALAKGARHSLGVDAAGKVWAWGDNSSGQLGLGHSRPVAGASLVTGLAGQALAVSAGTQHSAALLADGTVWVWGANNKGQLGRSPVDIFRIQSTPMRVSGLTRVVGLSGGDDFLLALTGTPDKTKKKSKNTVLRWGAGDAQPNPVTGYKVMVAVASAPASASASAPTPTLPVQTPPTPLAVPERAVAAAPAVPVAVAVPAVAPAPPPVLSPAFTPAPVSVSGVVRLSSGFGGAGSAATGEALANVQLSADGAQCAPTDNQGRYVCSMPSGWSGRIRVSRNNYQFSPSSLSFSNLRFDAGQQNFAAIYDPR